MSPDCNVKVKMKINYKLKKVQHIEQRFSLGFSFMLSKDQWQTIVRAGEGRLKRVREKDLTSKVLNNYFYVHCSS